MRTETFQAGFKSTAVNNEIESLVTEIYQNQEQQFVAIEQNKNQNQLWKIEKYITILRDNLSIIHQTLLNYSFENDEKEIIFFKNVLPRLDSQLIYYKKLQQIERRKPEGEKSVLIEYYQEELNKLNQYFKENIYFYEYHRSDSTYLDDRLFIRNRSELPITFEPFSFALDKRICTVASLSISVILAHKMLQEYLIDRLELLNRKNWSTMLDFGIQWTESRTALIELIYAFYYRGSFNKGNVEIKQLIKAFEVVLGFKIDNFYRVKHRSCMNGGICLPIWIFYGKGS